MVIFDFDQTLVDTQPVEHLRKARNWREVMKRTSELAVYDGIHDLLRLLHGAGIPTAIVTKSPSMVSKAIVAQHSWPIDIIIGYHDVSQRKPHPEGLQLAMTRASAQPGTTYHVGDDPLDTVAARAAGVHALGSAWGIPDSTALAQSRPDTLFTAVADLGIYLRRAFAI